MALAQTHDSDQRSTLQTLLAGVEQELKLHQGYAEVRLDGVLHQTSAVRQPANFINCCAYMQSWGVALSPTHAPTATTKAYTDMLLEVALNQVSTHSTLPLNAV